jgi:YfiH family protein
MINNFENEILRPNWSAPPKVNCFVTLTGWPDVNKSYRGDGPEIVTNRNNLEKFINVDNPIQWVDTVHQNKWVSLPATNLDGFDGIHTSSNETACILTVADCLPILFTNKAGSNVGVAHCGWRSLQSGLLDNICDVLETNPQDLLVWLGPGISKVNYEVGGELVEKFESTNIRLDGVFEEKEHGKFYLNLYQVAMNILNDQHIPSENVYGGELCAFSDMRFPSVRRDGKNAGRMAVVIWMEK